MFPAQRGIGEIRIFVRPAHGGPADLFLPFVIGGVVSIDVKGVFFSRVVAVFFPGRDRSPVLVFLCK